MSAAVQPGALLAGKYRVERVLGVGGMGMVVAAVHIHLDERVALKFLLPEMAGHPDVVTRFLREGRAAVKIRSEHVARVSDVGTLETGAPYIVMEYLDGKDLAQHLAAHGPLPIAEAVEAVLQACEALAEAHALGIVHRDLKPANLFVTTRVDGSRCVKVLDFGISKLTQGADAAMTKTSSMMGSPLYMSPEQMASAKNVDGRSDIWALGVILYELVCGRPPFEGDSVPAVCAQILTAEPPPLASHGVTAPGLQSVIDRCLAKNRDARFFDVSQFVTALAPFAPPSARLSIDRVQRIIAGNNAPRASSPTTASSTITITQTALPVPAPAQTAPMPFQFQPPAPLVTTAGATASPPISMQRAQHDGIDDPFARRARPAWVLPTAVGGGALALAVAIYAIASSGKEKTADPPAAAATSTTPSTTATESVATTGTPASAPVDDTLLSYDEALKNTDESSGGDGLSPAECGAVGASLVVGCGLTGSATAKFLVQAGHVKGLTVTTVPDQPSVIGCIQKAIATMSFRSVPGAAGCTRTFTVGESAPKAPPTGAPTTPPKPVVAPTTATAPPASPTPTPGNCPSWKGDYPAASRAGDWECVRTLLLPRLNGGVISSAEAKYLKAACNQLADVSCANRAAGKI